MKSEVVRAQFSEKELFNLTLVIVAISGANRLNIALRTVPGSPTGAARSHGGRSPSAAGSELARPWQKLAAAICALFSDASSGLGRSWRLWRRSGAKPRLL